MSAALVLGDAASPAVRSAVRAARACVGESGGSRVDVLLIGPGVTSGDTKKWQGVTRVFAQETSVPSSAEQVTRVTRELLTRQSDEKNKYSHVLAAADTFGKNVVPRIAGRMGVASLSDILQVIDGEKGIYTRPMYAGNAIATVQMKEELNVMTIRPTSFSPVNVEDNDTVSEMETLNLKLDHDDGDTDHPRVKWINMSKSERERPELGAASVVVAGGRGLKSKEQFRLLEDMADTLNGAVGATRAAVDLGWVPNDLQIGQTGKIIAPKLYFAVGVSGAIQHLAGMKDSQTIVAINKDADAPIFQVADYGIVGDLFDVVPQLIEKLKQLPKEQ